MATNLYDAMIKQTDAGVGFGPKMDIYRVVPDSTTQTIEGIPTSVWGDQGPIILIIPGYPSNPSLFRPLRRLLSSFCRTVCVDFFTGIKEWSCPIIRQKVGLIMKGLYPGEKFIVLTTGCSSLMAVVL